MTQPFSVYNWFRQPIRVARGILGEYAQVIIALLIAGAIMGSCRTIETPAPKMVPMMRVRDCGVSQPIRLMPNWIKNWNPPHYERRA